MQLFKAPYLRPVKTNKHHKYMITQYRFVIIHIIAMLIFTTNAIAQNITIVAPVKGENFIDGHEYVDLGLSVKWVTCNIGAENSWDYGDYYSWGRK